MQHRQREKEYRQKLAKLKEKERIDIRTEEDLFKKLDQLEVEEALEDEIYRFYSVLQLKLIFNESRTLLMEFFNNYLLFYTIADWKPNEKHIMT